MDENDPLSEAAIRRRAKKAFKEFRASREWSMREMADYLGVPPDRYEGYEKPDRGVPPDVIARFCHNNHISTDWIMLGKKTPSRKKIEQEVQASDNGPLSANAGRTEGHAVMGRRDGRKRTG